MSKSIIVAAAILVIGLVSAPLEAQGKSQGRGRGNGNDKNDKSATSVSVAFTFNDRDRVAFHDYFATHRVTVTPLPPGIAKNVARGKPLPPGIAKKAVPADLVMVVAPRAGNGVTFSIVGDRVVALRAGVVVDVMINVFR